ncbi:enoyl-CoA hydratase/isomerase family protein [Marinibaculum pumilum]|uniref:Enoyl-CoA hydratase/isomerase family protein n=1 Tax=Marinibaculum pumilum TaxID=1766165 RepID=A0ABV7L9R5_9PROT
MTKVGLEIEEGVALLRFDNPPDGLMDDTVEPDFAAALDAAEADASVRVVVLTGAQEGVFIRHYDVALLARRAAEMRRRGMQFGLDRPVPEAPFHAILRRIESSPRPYIAAINGTAMGGGFELALACDFRLAQDGDFSLGLPEVNLGILPGAGGTQRLARTIGPAAALWYIARGETLSPRDAAAAGLVHECVDGDVVAAALDLAARLKRRSGLALSHIKALVRQHAQGPLDAGLAAERTLFCDLMVSDEAATAMEAVAAGTRDIRQG